MVKLKLQDLQRIRKTKDCTDLSQVSQALNWVEGALYDLYQVSRRLITERILQSDLKDHQVGEFFKSITSDAGLRTTDGFSKSLERLVHLIDAIEARRYPPPDMTQA